MGRPILLVLLVLLMVPLGAQSPATPLQVPYQQFRLANGLNVILHRDTSIPAVAVNVWYYVGSANEKPGRTGFAHLFEHLMFEGSKHVPEGEFDILLEGAGGDNNGSTSNDRTNYVIDVPANALELALFLESDRMGYLLDTMSPERVDGQRDVVKNERRQSSKPAVWHGVIELDKMLWPATHPYNWPTIGHMEDLTAASYSGRRRVLQDVLRAEQCEPGDRRRHRLRPDARAVEKWFGEIPRGPVVEPIAPPAAILTDVQRKTLTDNVTLPRLYLAWLTPRFYAPGDSALDVTSSVLTGGKNSRLYKRLVYDMQIAQDVSAFQQSGALGSSFMIVATARSGHTAAELQKVIDEELDRLRRDGPEPREVQRAINQMEASFYRRMERIGSFGGKADQLNAYAFAGGGPDYFAEDLARYTSLSPADIRSAALQWLPPDRRVELVVEPEGKK